MFFFFFFFPLFFPSLQIPGNRSNRSATFFFPFFLSLSLSLFAASRNSWVQYAAAAT
jgi:hypothetical protein